MEILFLSGTCSSTRYRKIFEQRTRKFIDPSQKFFSLLIKGISNNTNVTCISALPVSNGCHKRLIWKREEELKDNVKYIYPGFINGKISRIFTGYITIYRETKNFCKSKRDVSIIYDPTDLRYSLIIRRLRKKYGFKAIALITDIPSLATVIGHNRQSALKNKLQKVYDIWADELLEIADGFILLTKQMNDLVNKKDRPYVVIEGSVDAELKYSKNMVDNRKVIMYAGGVHEKFGIIKLVQAFVEAELNEIELHIYGAGEAIQQIKEISTQNPMVKYMGVLPVENIVEEEMKAMILVNPRPVKERFTQFSFPSKTLEYMSTGTPVLTTKLQGIPEEYFQYVFTFENDDVATMKEKLIEISHLTLDELCKVGKEAFDFIQKEKNNIIQGKRIIEFISRIR